MSQQQARISIKIDGLTSAIKDLESARKALEELRKRGKAVNAELEGSDFGAEQVEALTNALQDAGVGFEVIEEQIAEATEAVAEFAAESSVAVNTIAALEERAGVLSTELKGLDIGSEAFRKTKRELEAVNSRLALATVSTEDVKQAFADAGQKAAETMTLAAGITASFGAENEDAAQAILMVQQALAAVELIRSASEAAQLQRKAELVAAEQQYAGAVEAGTDATQEQAVAQDRASKSGRGLAGTIKGLAKAIAANPILALAGALTAAITAIVALSGKFRFFARIVEGFQDTVGGVSQVFKDLGGNLSAVGDIITGSFTVALDAGNAAIQGIGGTIKALLGFDNPFAEYDQAAKQLNGSLKQAADAFGAVTDAYERGVERTRAIRANEQAIALKEVADTGARIREAELGSVRQTEDERRGIRLKGLAEDRKLLEERLRLQADLSEDELQVLKTGTAEQIKELRKVVDARGRVDQEVLQNLQAFEAAQTALLAEQEAARLAAIQDRVRGIDDLLAIEQARLANVENFVNKGLELERRYDAERQKLALARQAGEFKSQQEYQRAVALLEQQRINESGQLARDLDAFNLELLKQRIDVEVQERERVLAEGQRLRTLDFEQQVGEVNRIRDLRIEALDAEFRTLDQRRDEDRKRAGEIAAERAALDIELSEQVRAIAVATAQQVADAEAARLSIAQGLLDLERQRGDLAKAVSDDELAKAQEALDRQRANTANLTNATKDYRQQLEIINLQQQAAADEIDRQLQLTLQTIEVQRQQVQAQLALNEAKRAAGEIGDLEFDQARQALDQQLKALQQQADAAQIQASIELDVNERQAKEQARQALDAYAGFLSGYLKGPVAAEVSQAINNLFGQLGPVINELGQQAAQQLMALVATVQEAKLAQIDSQIEETARRVEEAGAILAEVEAAAEESSSRIQALTAQALAAQGEQQSAIIAQIDAERQKREELAAAQKKQAAEQRRLVQQQMALERQRVEEERKQRRQQKVFQVANAIANTAVGITRTIAEVPKRDYGVSTAVLVALYAALGAAQVATIAAQPARKGGLLGEDGGLKKLAGGGILNGPSHEAGGIRGTGSFAGIEVEGGEAIIPKRAVANNIELVKQLIEDGPIRKLRNGALQIAPPSSRLAAAAAEARSTEQVDRLQATVASTADRKVVVSVLDIAEAQQRVQVIDNVATL